MSIIETKNERAFPLPKEVIDTVNSVSWFLMDAFWMLQAPWVARAMILPTVATGFILLYIEKRRPVVMINLAINCWILMNICWMLADNHQIDALLTASRTLFALGLVCIGFAVRYSENLKETFSHFRRSRIMQHEAVAAPRPPRKTLAARRTMKRAASARAN